MLLKETRIKISRFFNFLISRGMAPFLTGLVFLLIDWLILSGIDRAVTAATYRPPAPGEPLAYYHSFQSDQKILVLVLNLFPFLWIYGAILRSFSQAAAGESFSFRAFISGGFKVYWRCLLFGLGTVLFLVPFVFMWVITRVFVSEPAALLIAVNILFLLPALALAVPFHAFATIPGAADRKFLRHIPACLIWSVILGAVLQVPVAGPYIFPALFLLYLSAVIFSREELKKPDK